MKNINKLPETNTLLHSLNLEEENKKIKNEAKNLIEKTRKVIEDLELNKIKSPSFKPKVSFYSTNSRSLSPQNIHVHLPENPTENITLITTKLLEKTKLIKGLERDLKDKNALIEQLHSKLDKKNQEISRLNESLIVIIIIKKF